MRKLSTRVRHFIQNHKWYSAGIAVVCIFLFYFIFGRSKSTLPTTVAAAKHNVVEVVSATGNVKPLASVDISFEKGGKVSDIAVTVDQTVHEGQYLASVSNSDLAAAVEQAKAGLKIAQANLASLQSGSTPQQVAVSQSQVAKAQSDLAQAKASLINTIADGYTKSDDSIRSKTDVMFNNPTTENPTLKFQADFALANTLSNTRVSLEKTLIAWNTAIANLNSNSDVQAAVNTANTNLSTIKTFLDNLALAINNLSSTSGIDATTLATWKSNLSTARTSIALAITNLSTAGTAYQSTVSALSIAQNQLSVTTAGATVDAISAQEAAVEQAQANVDSAEAALEKSIIRSPIEGVITHIDPSVGETVASGVNVISVISYGSYEVEAYIAEADIAKIKIGDIATTTLDAYGTETYFTTQVIKIDPAETVIEDVPTYKVTLKFVANDDRVRSGMTANLDILTNEKVDALAVPSRAVYTADGIHKVQLLDAKGNTIEQAVETGIRGVDGYIEITSGLSEGEQIVAAPNI